jgi:4-amino-4-deoxy-L-arabinose transferase-like glycosyltransferase
MNRRIPRPTMVVGLVALLTGLMAQLWAHQADVVLAFWDAQAHLDIARRVVDSTTPGLQMLGTVWLPIPHLLYLPFTLVDPWWWNGLAGGLVGLLAYLTTVMAVEDLARRRLGAGVPATVAVLVVLLNPSLLYLQTTAMTEPLLLAFMTASVAVLDRWWEEPSGSGGLLMAGVLAALAVGSRYDGWFFVAVATPLVWWRARRAAAALRFVAPALLVVLAWLGYNWFFFGDALEFQRGVWSAAAQQRQLADEGLLPTAGAPFGATGYYLGAAGLTVGWLVLSIGALGVLSRWRATGGAAFALLGSALVFNVTALVAGQSVIALPWTDPAGVLNLRYGLMLLPLAALGLGALLAGLRHRRGMLLASLAVVALQAPLWAWRWPSQVGALREGVAIRDGDPAQMVISRWLAGAYDRGRVLVSPAVNISPRARVPLADRVYPWTWALGDSALADPGAVVDWVVVDREADEDPVRLAIEHNPGFARQFLLAFREGRLEVWQRR